MLTLDDMVTLYPDQVWLEIPPEVCQAARQTLQTQAYSNPVAVERAYRNIVCQTLVADWLLEDPDLPTPVSWLSPQAQPGIWEFVNGSILLLNTTRLALIPSDTTNFDELSVEQEWVDIPGWAAHYYLAVQLNLWDGWLRIAGYTTHDKLKQRGTYDEMDRTYNLDSSELIEDLNVLWIARESSPTWMPTVAALLTLSRAIATPLITQLSQNQLASPRLDLPSEQWLSLVANHAWRENLYQQRTTQQNLAETLGGVVATPAAQPQPAERITLSGWLQNTFEPGWQAVNELVNSLFFNTYAMAKGTSPQEKAIQLGEYTLGLIVACDRSPTPKDSSDNADTTPEIIIRTGIRLIQGSYPLTESLEVTFIFNDESEESFPIQFQDSNPVVPLPTLLANSGGELTLLVKLGTFQYPLHFTV